MKYELAKTKNVRMFQAAVGELLSRTPGVIEGMGLLYGEAGEGKTTVVAHAANVYHGVCLRATAGWTMTHMLGSLMRELNGEPLKRRAPMVDWIVEQLARQERVIFVDEADYLFEQTEMLDVLRDIYDLSGAPVILIGMEKIARKIQGNGRFARRITQWIEFKGIDRDDARTVADTVCEVKVADDLLAHLHKESKANIGRIVVGLSRIENMGQASNLASVTLSDWGNRSLFYDQPVFRKRG